MAPVLLIVSADDYGLTLGVSRAILRAHREGIVSSTSVLAVGRAFGRACPWLRDAPALGIGVHLAAVGEDPPLLSAREIPSLVSSRGRFARSWRQFVWRAATVGFDRAELAREFSAQVEAVASYGLPISHLDTHQHLHLWPSVRDVVLGVATKHGVGGIRHPRSPPTHPMAIATSRLARAVARGATRSSLRHPALMLGLRESGRLDTATLLRLLTHATSAGASSVEIITHPGEARDPDLDRFQWGYGWPRELAACLDSRARRLIATTPLKLATYRELPRR
jgi:predicted glycoside hydrolase/deacetylase ChbG (UPF0249 family)